METSHNTSNRFNRKWVGGVLAVAVLLGIFGFITVRGLSSPTAQPASQAAVATKTVSCTGSPAHRYQITFTDKGVQPSKVAAHLCDQVVLINNSSEEVIAAIGPHTHHIHYPGFEETALSHGQSYAFRLPQTGSLFLHDHDNEALNSTINVQ